MRTLVKVLVLGFTTMLLAGCLVSLPSVGNNAPPPPGGTTTAEHIPDEVLVRLTDDAVVAEVAGAIGSSTDSVRRFPDGLARIKLPPGASMATCLDALNTFPGVVYAERVYIYRYPEKDDPDMKSERGPLLQKGMEAINADDVWDLPLPPNLAGLRVAVVDTGIDLDNPELNIASPGYNAIEDNGNCGDDEGHGTHVAGIIGAIHNNGIGIDGVAGGITLVPVKVLSATGEGTNQSVANGILWAADPALGNADVINLSLGGWGRSQAIQEAIDYAIQQGVVVVAAMGNTGRDSITHYPAASEGVIAVGASMLDGTWANFSTTGPHISVAAPGKDIMSTVWTSTGYTFAPWSGTSMATPHVTGAVALLLSKTPRPGLLLIRSILERTAVPGTWTSQIGYGRIDALAAYNDSNLTPLYGGLVVKVTYLGTTTAVKDAEVLIKQGNTTKTANRTNEYGETAFHFLRAETGTATYQVYVTDRSTGRTASSSVQITAGQVWTETLTIASS